MENVPVELLARIFSELPYFDLLAVSSVCNLWYQIIQEDTFIRQLMFKTPSPNSSQLVNGGRSTSHELPTHHFPQPRGSAREFRQCCEFPLLSKYSCESHVMIFISSHQLVISFIQRSQGCLITWVKSSPRLDSIPVHRVLPNGSCLWLNK